MMPQKVRPWTSKSSGNANLQPTTTIEDLPDEVLLQVLSYIDQEELQSTIPLVSRRWNALHDDPSLYRTLTFEKNNPPTSVAVKMINMAPWLTSLTMIQRTDTDELLRHVGPNHPNLVKLLVRICWGSSSKLPVSSEHLINVARNCTLLQNVSLDDTQCDSSTFYEKVGQMLPNLRIIDFGILIAINPGALTHIVKYFNNIEEMRLGYSHLAIPEEEVLAFVQRCRESLSVIDFNNNVVWSDKLLASMAKCLNLKELNLVNATNITDNGLMAISHLTNVKYFTICVAHMISSQCWLIFVHTPLMRKLQKLGLHSSSIDVHMVNAIGLALREIVEVNICGLSISFHGRMAPTMPDLLDSSSRELDETPARVETSSLLFPLVNHLIVSCMTNDCHVLSLIGRMRNLVHLEIRIHGVTNEGIMAFALLPKLLELTLLDGKAVTREGWIQFFKSSNVTKLRHLEMMSCTNVEDFVACAIATNLRQLQFLRIIFSTVSEEGQQSVKQLVSERCKVHFNL